MIRVRAGGRFSPRRAAAVSSLMLLLSSIAAPAAEGRVLTGHVPAAIARLGLSPAGRLPATNRLHLAIGLPLRNPDALAKLLGDLFDPASPRFRRYLTPQEFADQFAPTTDDYQAAVQFAKSHGLEITASHPNRLILDVAGQVTDIEKGFHVTLRTYSHPLENRLFYAPDVEPSPDLPVPLLHISGLDNYVIPRPMSLRQAPIIGSTRPVPATGSGPGGAYLGGDFRAAYLPGVSLTGSGQVLGLLEFDGYFTNDVATYESQAGLPNVPLKNVLLDGFDGLPGRANLEVSLDIDMSVSMAPGLASVIVYEGFLTDDILSRMATDNLARQLSASWSYAIDSVTEQIFQEFAAQGQSFFNASGDYDAYTAITGVPTPCDDPNITIVGGTTLTTSGPGGAWVSETVWNWDVEYGASYDGEGSGGGISGTYPIPPWQQGLNMTTNQGSTTFRNLPDVALTADNVFLIYNNGETGIFGGTSCATPLWAAFTALVNQQALAGGNPPVGFLNPALYALGSELNHAAVFHDITNGNNTWSGSPNLFYAVPGYDLCTGWGTPAGTNLLKALATPEPLRISPATGFSASGKPGGPFIAASQNFTLTNVGLASLDWTLGSSAPWLTTSSSGGLLTPGGPATNVTVSLNTAAYSLPAGVYVANLMFTNLNDGIVQARQFTLALVNPPIISAEPANQEVYWGASAAFTVGASGGLPLSYQWQFNGVNLTDGGNVSGSATSTLTLLDVSLAVVGSYSVIVSNSVGAIASSNAFLKIISSGPIITLPPTNQTVIFGSNATLVVGAVGNQPLFYQWRSNGFNLTDGGKISGSATDTLTVSNLSAASGGTYSVIVSNSVSSVSTGAVLTVVVAEPNLQLVQNGGFETGSFSSWSQSGNFSDCSVSTSPSYVYSGLYGALLGPVGSLGFLSQTLPTSPGAAYLLSLWLDSPDGLGPNEFQVAWNGSVLFDQTNLGVIGWTNLQFTVSSTNSSTLLQLGFRDDQSFLGLDNIQVTPLVSADGPPIIVTQPASVAAPVGGAASFSVVSAGQLPLLYQWQFNATNLPSATNMTLTLTNLVLSQSGLYDVLVSNSVGSAASSNALLTVATGTVVTTTNSWDGFNSINDFGYPNTGTYGQTFVPPSLPFGLTSFTVYIQNTFDYVSFRFYIMAWNGSEATGPILYESPETNTSGALGFQAYTFNTGNLALTPGASYVAFASITPDCLGQSSWGSPASYPYTQGEFVYLNNGTDFSLLTETPWDTFPGSDLAFVAVFGGNSGGPSPPDITAQPVNQSADVGSSATFCVTASGTPPLSYLWQLNGTEISGATNSCFTVNDVQLSNSGSQFSCLVSNAYGFMLSSNGTLTVAPPSPFGDAVAVYGAPGASSWNNDVTNKILNTLLLPKVSGFLAGAGQPTPTLAQLEQYGAVLVYSDDSFNDSIGMGNVLADYVDAGGGLVVATFGFNSAGDGLQGRLVTGGYLPLTTGAQTTGFDLSLAADQPNHPILEGVQSFNGGSDSYHEVVTTTPGATLVAHWTDGQPLVATKQLTAGRVVALNFYPPSSTARGDFWEAGTDGGLLMANALLYSLALSRAPALTAQPASQTISAGSSATFSVAASGPPPFGYSWSRNGNPIPGATLTNYTLTNSRLSDSGALFSCLVSNVYGIVNSSNALLVVFPPSLVLNGGFETGDFSFWTLSGNLDSADGLVTTNSPYIHSGGYGAQLGPAGSLGLLSQALPTLIGQSYVLSLWLNTPNAATPNEFVVAWNGTNLYDQLNLAPGGWTNLQFFVTAATTNTSLQFGVRNDPSYFGLDDIFVYPVAPPQLQTVASANGAISLSWSGLPGLLYQVQYTTNLASPNWSNFVTTVTPTGPTLTATDSVTNAPQRFYRLLLSP